MSVSLRTRLLLAAGTVALGAVLLVDVSTYLTVSASQLKQVDTSLATSHPPIEQLARDGSARALASIPEIAPGTYVAVIDANGEVVFQSAAVRGGDEPVTIDPDTLGRLLIDPPTETRNVSVRPSAGDEIRVRIDPLGDRAVLITGQSLHEVNESRNRLLRVLVLATGGAGVLISGLGWLLVWLGLSPLRQVENSARMISDGAALSHRVPGADPRTEVGRLATTLNEMLEQLESANHRREETMTDLRASEARMRRFVADASHELRTPVAATAAYAELFDAGARERPDDLQRAMTGIQSETARMSALISDLLLLARIDESVVTQNEIVDFTEVVLAAVEAARTIDPTRPHQVSIAGVIEVAGDQSRLRQVVDNLLANVRAHTPPGTPCRLTLATTDVAAVLTVEDEGPGVEPSQLDRLFERFYRADPSRTRNTGGSGLGLAIVGSIVEAHGGTISVQQNEPSGLRVIVELPRLLAHPRPEL